MTAINFSQNAYFTVRCAEILDVSPVAPHYVISAAFLAAQQVAKVSGHLLRMAYDWLSSRSIVQRGADVALYEKERYMKLDEAKEVLALRKALEEAKRAASDFVGRYSVFAGCNVITYRNGRKISVRTSGNPSAILA